MWAQTSVPYVLWHDIFLKITIYFTLFFETSICIFMTFGHMGLPTPPPLILPKCPTICTSPICARTWLMV